MLSVTLDGAPLGDGAYGQDAEGLTVLNPPAGPFTLETQVEIAPKANTRLEGLYQSNGIYCTQCEAEGFRRITWYLDRPDVMAIFTTRISGDKARYPVLLSNGNRVEHGDLLEEDG